LTTAVTAHAVAIATTLHGVVVASQLWLHKVSLPKVPLLTRSLLPVATAMDFSASRVAGIVLCCGAYETK